MVAFRSRGATLVLLPTVVTLTAVLYASYKVQLAHSSSSASDSLSGSTWVDTPMEGFSSVTRGLAQAAENAADKADEQAKLPQTSAEHCVLTKDSWCGGYWAQEDAPRLPPPRGDKECPNNCNNVGQCDYDTGMCNCPVGWQGKDCSEPRRRPCWRMGKDKRDLNWTKYTEWSHSRCAGLCDDMNSMCYCPPETKYGIVPAPEGSPYGTPPVRRGRPIYWCQPSSDQHGNKIMWGAVSWEDLLGPDSWCNADVPKFKCPCRLDGFIGELCNIPVEQYCMNSCSGQGECLQGFCKCYDGYYGQDCSRLKKGARARSPDQDGAKPWLAPTITDPVAAHDPPILPKRKRPYVYVYDVKAEFHSDVLQMRIERGNCMYRSFVHGNRTEWVAYYAYSAEPVLHELFLASEHRTFDPEEADFFFVPTAAACLFDVYGWNPIPKWPANSLGPRPYGAAGLIKAAQKWVSTTFPYFNRTGGKDHIWYMGHDEGACYAPVEIWPGILLSHWGRMDMPHISNSQYHADNYSSQMYDNEWYPEGWLKVTSQAHPCFDPKKDLVVPPFKQPPHYARSVYMGVPPAEKKDILLFFRGDVGKRRGDDRCVYSRCIRQTLYKLSKEQEWKAKHNALYGDNEDVPGDYSQLIGRSKFCLALPGDGWSARLEDALLHGCVPVIVMDNTQVAFENVLDFDKFSLRVAQADLSKLIDIVAGVSNERYLEMQANVHKVWHRFRYMGLTLAKRDAKKLVERNRVDHGGKIAKFPGREFATSDVDDAFSTIMQWLFHRIPYTRGGAQPAAAAAAAADKEKVKGWKHVAESSDEMLRKSA